MADYWIRVTRKISVIKATDILVVADNAIEASNKVKHALEHIDDYSSASGSLEEVLEARAVQATSGDDKWDRTVINVSWTPIWGHYYLPVLLVDFTYLAGDEKIDLLG